MTLDLISVTSNHSMVDSVLILSGVIIIAYTWLKIVYNILLHPLSRFPGPNAAAASRVYYDYLTFQGRQIAKTKEWHDLYGEVVRVAPNQLSFTDPQAWRDIYMHQQNCKQLKKFPFFPIMPRPPNLIFAEDDATHGRQRRTVSHAFSDRALREQEPMIQSYVNKLMANFAADASVGVATDVVKEFNYCTFDVIGDFAFGESFGMLESRKAHWYAKRVFGDTQTMTLIMAATRALGLVSLLTSVLGWLASVAKFESELYVHEKVGARIDAGELQRPDLLTGIIRVETEDGTVMPRGEIDGIASVLLAAGSETTATLMSTLTFFLLEHPQWLARVQDEVRKEFTAVGDVTLLRISRLPLVNAVIEESLRLKPPAPAVFPRVTPSEGTIVCGQRIPGNAIVGIPAAASQWSERSFHAAQEFHPERWFSGVDLPEVFKNDVKAASAPFSKGPRNCVGQNLALAEMRIMTARLLWQFDMDLVGPKQWADQKVYTIWQKSGLMVRMRDRLSK